MAVTENGHSSDLNQRKNLDKSGRDATKTKDTDRDGKTKRTFIQRNAFILTIMMATMVDGLTYAVRGQFRYRFFHSKYEDELAQYNATSGCGVEPPPEVQAIENKITAETTQWNLYELYVSIVPLMVATVVFGLKSDQIGRRFIFIFPFFTALVDCIGLAIVIWFNFHFGYTLIGIFVYSASGGNLSMAVAGYALISDTHGKHRGHRPEGNSKQQTCDTKSPATDNDDDVTDLDMSREHSRTFKIVVLDTLRKLSSSAIAFATGYVIQYAGFFYTIILVIGIRVLIFIFACCFVTETGEQRKSAGFIAPLRTIVRATKNPRKRLSLLLVNFGLLFSVFSLVDEVEVMRTYQMSPPFCFNAIMLGYYNSENRIKSIFALPLMWIFRKIRLSESTIAAVGLLAHASGALLLSTVRQTWVFWAIPVMSIPGDLTVPMAKALTSRMVGRRALASTFAIMMAAEELFWFAGSNATNYLYKTYVATLPTAPFYLAFASFVFSSLLFIAQTFHQRIYPDAITENTNLEKNIQEPVATKL